MHWPYAKSVWNISPFLPAVNIILWTMPHIGCYFNLPFDLTVVLHFCLNWFMARLRWLNFGLNTSVQCSTDSDLKTTPKKNQRKVLIGAQLGCRPATPGRCPLLLKRLFLFGGGGLISLFVTMVIMPTLLCPTLGFWLPARQHAIFLTWLGG